MSQPPSPVNRTGGRQPTRRPAIDPATKPAARFNRINLPCAFTLTSGLGIEMGPNRRERFMTKSGELKMTKGG